MSEKNTTEAADLARTILENTEDEHHTAMYILSVREVRILANAALAADRLKGLADDLDADAAELGRVSATFSHTIAANLIRRALNGETR